MNTFTTVTKEHLLHDVSFLNNLYIIRWQLYIFVIIVYITTLLKNSHGKTWNYHVKTWKYHKVMWYFHINTEKNKTRVIMCKLSGENVKLSHYFVKLLLNYLVISWKYNVITWLGGFFFLVSQQYTSAGCHQYIINTVTFYRTTICTCISVLANTDSNDLMRPLHCIKLLFFLLTFLCLISISAVFWIVDYYY